MSYIVSAPRSGLALFIRGQKNLIPVGKFWIGRPHIHIVSFEGQQETATENERHHSADFAQIIARTARKDSLGVRQFLPEDSRPFDDYNAYVSSGISLWIWAKKGLRRQTEWSVGNRGHLIYGHQAVIELLEYGYMLHRSLIDRINSYPYEYLDEVLETRRNLVRLKVQLELTSHYGEIRDLLDNAWDAMGVPNLQANIAEGLAISEAQTSIDETRQSERIGRALTILFGLVAVPPLATDVIRPLWNYLGLWQPQSAEHVHLLSISVSAILITLIAVVLIRYMSGNKNRT